MLDHKGIVICKSQPMAFLYDMVRRVAPTSYSVLITGATGSGKEIIARMVHCYGNFPDAPFIDVNCGGIPEALMESELFGHEKGAFTGAAGKHRGSFDLAGKGVLFLDEIGELPLSQQAKLLRVLETKTFRPVGSENSVPFLGRVIAATNRNLEELVEEKKFREDLYYRLNVFRLEIPDLCERREDIPDLVRYFAEDQGRVIEFCEEAVGEMAAADWPGNVRQLRNFVDRVAVLSGENPVRADTVRRFLAGQSKNPCDRLGAITDTIMALDFENKIAAIEYHVIQRALEKSGGNKSAAAKAVGVHRKVIERRIRMFDADMKEIQNLCVSGKRAMALSGYGEALQHYERALDHVKKYPCSLKFDALKLEILLKQCICLRNFHGWNSRKAEKKYEEAVCLGKRLYQIEKLHPAYFGIWAQHLMRLDLRKALHLAKKYFHEGRALNSPYLISQACIALANTCFWLGDFRGVQQHLADFLDLFGTGSEMVVDHGHDPFAFYLMFAGLAAFHTGDFKQAGAFLCQLEVYAGERRHPFSTAIALQAGAWLAFLLRDDVRSVRYSRRLTEEMKESPFLFYRGIGMIFKGYHMALSLSVSDGILLIRQGFEDAGREGGLLFHSMYAILLARVYAMAGLMEEALEVIEKGIAIAEEKEEFCYLSGLMTARGEWYGFSGENDRAEEYFRAALDIAKRLGDVSAGLDAGMGLADLLVRNGRRKEGRDILQETLSTVQGDADGYEPVRRARAWLGTFEDTMI